MDAIEPGRWPLGGHRHIRGVEIRRNGGRDILRLLDLLRLLRLLSLLGLLRGRLGLSLGLGQLSLASPVTGAAWRRSAAAVGRRPRRRARKPGWTPRAPFQPAIIPVFVSRPSQPPVKFG